MYQKIITGGWTPCGNSGGLLWSTTDPNGNPTGSSPGLYYTEDGKKYPYVTCCCLTGSVCHYKQMYRRWSCCGVRCYGTIKKALALECSATN